MSASEKYLQSKYYLSRKRHNPRTKVPGEIELSSIRKGQIFYEVDAMIAVKWIALEDAREVTFGVWAVPALRKNRVVCELRWHEDSGGRIDPKLFSVVSDMVRVIE